MTGRPRGAEGGAAEEVAVEAEAALLAEVFLLGRLFLNPLSGASARAFGF